MSVSLIYVFSFLIYVFEACINGLLLLNEHKMHLRNLFIFFMAIVISSRPNDFHRDLTELEELNLAADNIIGPLLRQLVLIRLKNLLCQKMVQHDFVHMRIPDRAFRTLVSNKKKVFASLQTSMT